MTHQIAEAIFDEFKIIMTVGIYATNNTDEDTVKMREQLQVILKDYPDVLQMHGFYADFEEKLCTFDLVVDFKGTGDTISQEVAEKMKNHYPEMNFVVVIDSNYAD